LVNTGWTVGPYGIGERMKLSFTRAMIHTALEGELNDIETVQDDIFGFHIPVSISAVPDKILEPKNTWNDKYAYDRVSQDLAQKFHENFKKFTKAPNNIKHAGPLFK